MQLVAVVRSMLLPHGFPDSVDPQFAPYMSWRAAQVSCPPRPIHVCSLLSPLPMLMQRQAWLANSARSCSKVAFVELTVLPSPQYFFGGAMGVLSTRSLLGALGISSRRTGEASAAINWVVKDGVGKLSRLLFARWCELVLNPDTEQLHSGSVDISSVQKVKASSGRR